MEPDEEVSRAGPVEWVRPAALIVVLLGVLGVVVWLQLGGGSGLLANVFRQRVAGQAHSGQPSQSPTTSGPALNGISPPARIAAGLVPQIADRLPGALLFGGRTAFRGLNCVPDLWQWNGSGWTRLPVPVKLPCIEPHFAATNLAAPGSDAAAQAKGRRLVLIAQSCDACPLETWTTAGGVDWQRYGGTSPPARRGYAVAVDANAGTVVLFGGMAANSGELLGDTWTWDGVGWSPRAPLHSPPARSLAGATSNHDSTSGMVLFGGAGAQGDLADTWEWTGTDWLQMHPAHSPAARESGAMAFGIAAGGTTLFGGVSSGTYLADTWSWDGTDWTQLSPQHHPSARAAAAFGSDSQGDLILFGGDQGARPNNETWTFYGNDWLYQLE